MNGLLVILGVAAFSGTVLGAALVQFPQTQRAIDSPDKKYSIYNRNSDQEPNHSLYIHSRASGADEKILDYGRSVDVMWSPDSDMFFVNDHSGSSETTCLVFFIDGSGRLDIEDLLKTIGEGDILSSDHLYIACQKWSQGGLVVVADGYGSDKYPNGIERKYLVNPRKQAMRRVG